MTKPIELEQAVEKLIQNLRPLHKTITVSLFDALHCYLAEDLHAQVSVPAFNRSAMDGYAIKAALSKGVTKEAPLKLKVIAELAAGASDQTDLHQAHAVRIMTGAPIPDGFDAVVRQEDTDEGIDEVEIYTAVALHTNYGKIGEDIRQGELVIAKHTRLTPIHLGMIASVGISKIEVFQPLKVGLISTGSELIHPGETLKYGQIYNSNHFVLAARLQELGIKLVFAKQLPDDTSAVCREIEQYMSEVDMIITTGGVSVGKKDIMHDVIKGSGAKQLFWRINMQPGTPMLASTYQEKLILSLSGNPFAALTTFELVVRPICAAFMQTEAIIPRRKSAILMTDFPKASKKRRFVRAYYEDGEVSLITPRHASSVLSSMLGCNCFIDIAEGSPGLKKGMSVRVVLLD